MDGTMNDVCGLDPSPINRISPIPLTGRKSATSGRADVGLCRQKWLFRGIALGSKPILPLSHYL